MGELNMQWEDGEIVELLQQINSISEDFWQDGEKHILANKEAPQILKDDLLSVLEVTNYVYENKFPLAVEEFKHLSPEQKGLLAMLIDWAMGECPCPYCTAERVVRAEMEEEIESMRKEETLRQERISHHLRMEEISRNKTYHVSEDVFQRLNNDKINLNYIIAKLEAAIDLLDEDDPRSEFASNILESYYENTY